MSATTLRVTANRNFVTIAAARAQPVPNNPSRHGDGDRRLGWAASVSALIHRCGGRGVERECPLSREDVEYDVHIRLLRRSLRK